MLKIVKKWAATLAGLMLWVGASYALALEVKPDAPTRYTVKKNDTLWDIAGIFLDKPWLWPELWRNNTQILNPHLIIRVMCSFCASSTVNQYSMLSDKNRRLRCHPMPTAR